MAGDANYGFPGYQQRDAFDTIAKSVDAQVQAIWAAIAYDLDLSYVGPLPGAANGTQRLRAPRDTPPKMIVDPSAAVSPTAWVCTTAHRPEVSQYIGEGVLVPVEIQLLTENKSLRDAIEQAEKDSVARGGVIDVVDIALARKYGVSSLPLSL